MKVLNYFYFILSEALLFSFLLIVGAQIQNALIWVASSSIIIGCIIYYILAKKKHLTLLKAIIFSFTLALIIGILLPLLGNSVTNWSLISSSILGMLIFGLIYCAETAPMLEGDGHGY